MKRFEVLAPEEVVLLHTKALTVLEKTGVKVLHSKMRSMLDELGFAVDDEQQLVRFPPELTETYVRKAPQSYTMGARSPKHNLPISDGVMYTRPMSGCHRVIDIDTGQCRDGKAQDVADLIRLTDALDQLDFGGGILYPWDCPVEVSDILLLRLAIENTSKHFQCQPFSGENLETMLKMLLLVAGSKEALRENPLLTATIAPTSPLQYMEHEIDIMLLAGEYGIPIMVGSTPIAGATGPVALANNLVLIHAETLAGIAMSQAINAGTPVTYGPRPNTLDMSTGIACWGCVEFGMCAAACQQLARHAGCWITDVSGANSESMTWDEQAGIERASNSQMLALAGTPILTGFGQFETICTASVQQLVIDNELIGSLRRLKRGVRVDEETVDIDVIDRVGHGGHYLDDEQTVSLFREEHYFPTLFNRKVRGTWETDGSKTTHDMAKEKAESILAEHVVEPLEPGIAEQLDAICQAAGAVRK